MTKFRTIQDGYMLAPRRGPAPEPPEGYEVAAGDPYIFLPKLPLCGNRAKKYIKRSCCGNIERMFCEEKNDYTTRLKCRECKNA